MTMFDIPFPRVLRIEPASQCNLACSHCPTGTVEMSRGIMPELMFARALEELRKNVDSVKVIVLYHGGEPLLNARFYQMVRKIKEIKSSLLVKSVSNGMALNEANAIKLIESGIDLLEVSLDGLSADESQYIRRNSDTQRVVNNIKIMIAMRNRFGSSAPVVCVATTQFIRSTRMTFPVQPAEPPSWLRDQFRDTVEYKASWGIKWPHMHVAGYDLLRDPFAPDKHYCDHIMNTITIRSDGNVVPCCYDLTSKLVMGNIMSETLRSIWSGEGYRRLRSSIATGDLFSICRACAVVKPPVYLVPLAKPDIAGGAKPET